MLEGKAYSELEPGMETEDDLEACMLLTNSQGRELLAPGKGAEQSDNKKIILKLIDGQASTRACRLIHLASCWCCSTCALIWKASTERCNCYHCAVL